MASNKIVIASNNNNYYNMYFQNKKLVVQIVDDYHNIFVKNANSTDNDLGNTYGHLPS